MPMTPVMGILLMGGRDRLLFFCIISEVYLIFLGGMIFVPAGIVFGRNRSDPMEATFTTVDIMGIFW